MGITLIGVFFNLFLHDTSVKVPRGGRSVLNKNVLSTAEELSSWAKRQTNDIGPRPWSNSDKTRITAKWIESELSEENIGYRPKITFLGDNKNYRMIEADLPGEKSPNEVLLVISSFSSPDLGLGAHTGASQTSTLGLARYFVNTENSRSLRFVAFHPVIQMLMENKFWDLPMYAKSKRASEKIIGVIEIGSLGYFSDAENSQPSWVKNNIQLPSKGNFVAMIGDEFSPQSLGSIFSGFQRHPNCCPQSPSV